MQIRIYLAALLLVGSTAVLSHPLESESFTKREEIPVDDCKKRDLSDMKVARTIAEITMRDIAIMRRCGGGGGGGGDYDGGDYDGGDDEGDNDGGSYPPGSDPDPSEPYPKSLPPVPELIQNKNPSELQDLAYWLQGKEVQTALSLAATTLALLGQALTPIGVGIAVTEGIIDIIKLVDPAP